MKTTGEYYSRVTVVKRYLRVVISLVILFHTPPDLLGFYLIPTLTYSFFLSTIS
ncbi:hypothetical protein HanRHA438_Chr13g0606221 [Helianthus annuus]|nr:hypothetical protein HanRHA438_Chr13g0606221 [Helianthus annuus]